ncbi:MAG: hypothetical protein ACRCXC_03130 [Legionella sp.]
MKKDLSLSHSPIYFILLLLCLTLVFHLLCKRKQIRINRWQKSLNLQIHAPIFHQLYHDANGFILSQQARQTGHDALEHSYGEIEFTSFIALLSLIQPDEHTVFYDLGSGVGKAVLACSMVFPVRKSVGIELFPELYFDACKRVELLAKINGYTEQAKKIHFVLGDFFDANLNDATLIFINSTAFFGPRWKNICAKLDMLPHLNTVITTSKALISTHFKQTVRTKIEMSWGVVFAYIHIRKTNSD